MKSVKSLLLIIFVAIVVASPARAQVPTLPAEGFLLRTPTCSTFDTGGRATTSFRAGDELILRGASFPPQVLVLASFRQPPHAVELARFKTGDDGGFTSEPTILRIPSDAVGGPASIRVSSSGGSASCDLSLTALPGQVAKPAPDDETESDELSPWLIVWATLVALGALYLAFARTRRWQAERLEQTIASRNGNGGARKRRVKSPPFIDDMPFTEPPQPRQEPGPSPPVLPVGWDDGREPIPVRQHGRRAE